MGKIITDLVKGTWNSATPYTIGAFVTYLGSTYICIVNNTDQVPTNTAYWVLFAQKGDTGNTGATGPQGPQGSGATVDTDPTLAANLDTNVASQKATKSFVASQIAAIPLVQTDGWISSSDALVRVSANSFKITGANRTAIYTKGTRVKFTNNAITYYGVVQGSAFAIGDTTVTLIANDDFTINNSAITTPFYSYQVNPQGYPGWFNFTPTITNPTGATGTLGLTFCKFAVFGSQIRFVGNYGSGSIGGTISGSFYNFTLPVNTDSAGYGVYAGDGHIRQGSRSAASVFSNLSTIDVGKYDQSSLSSATVEITFGITYGF